MTTLLLVLWKVKKARVRLCLRVSSVFPVFFFVVFVFRFFARGGGGGGGGGACALWVPFLFGVSAWLPRSVGCVIEDFSFGILVELFVRLCCVKSSCPCLCLQRKYHGN